MNPEKLKDAAHFIELHYQLTMNLNENLNFLNESNRNLFELLKNLDARLSKIEGAQFRAESEQARQNMLADRHAADGG